jgi:glutathione S-transferase
MNFTRLKLYHFAATRSTRVKWLLHESLDDDFDVEVVPVYECAQYSPKYLEKNPNHKCYIVPIRRSAASATDGQGQDGGRAGDVAGL